MITASAVRGVVLLVGVVGIAGMIVSSIAGSNGAAMTFGLVLAAAVLCLIVATAVTAAGGSDTRADDDAAALGERVERAVEELVASGADEERLRSLVGDAVRLGRATSR